tara:strand:+ start:3169 stop:3381 length:213 start_codon:yes stop_codon:yes gene_type:complete
MSIENYDFLLEHDDPRDVCPFCGIVDDDVNPDCEECQIHIDLNIKAAVAQLEEQNPVEIKVEGSSPSGGA